ncbi:hypothetical protein OJ996_14975 [Luteolibacter sp. GHJ8]|uniref:PepSY domain-containing protein n=1 Tax=Luteolibacter rhizosphaerae TaxID=2989719 RepID=A0ABT3G5P4_9BACT|nr:hypothetical protein [Luteolibacter rhizosphaerae]MCW1914889.1 hypothetical protein [Luteolibacter rhizosphaerae]
MNPKLLIGALVAFGIALAVLVFREHKVAGVEARAAIQPPPPEEKVVTAKPASPAATETPVEPAAPSSDSAPLTTMTREKAIESARAACAGKVAVPESAPVRVSEANGKVTVIFVQELPPGALGGDYHAKVTLDATSGEVIEILGSD